MHICPVCGYPSLSEPPRSPSGGGSYEICPSCGFQFGVDDDDRGLTYAQARERWVAAGASWWSRGTAAPAGWSAEAQLSALSKASGRTPRTKKSSSTASPSVKRKSAARKTPRKTPRKK